MIGKDSSECSSSFSESDFVVDGNTSHNWEEVSLVMEVIKLEEE